ncbi:MAG: 3D domain-containing protein [Clostridia bacterium]|nr:3D domain-containing protein [Clostridia bacterium]
MIKTTKKGIEEVLKVKFKITSMQLLYVILFQIVLINIFLGVLLFNTTKVKSESEPGTVNTKAVLDHGKTKKKGTEQRPLSKPESAPSKLKNNSMMSVHTDKKEDPLLKLIAGIDKYTRKNGIYKINDNIDEVNCFIATTYDLSYESCGKYPSHPEYGITFSGTKAVKGRTIAVDPNVIPLGSSVYLEFPSPYRHMNGWYKAEDTGRLVKGKIIDVFLGASAFYEMEQFGSRLVIAKVIPPES